MKARRVVEISPETVYVDRRGAAVVGRWPPSVAGAVRLADDAARAAAVIAAGVPPEGCSPEIAVSPARGRVVREVPRETVMTASGPRVRRSAPPGQDRLRIGDAFDEMEDQARRRHAHVRRQAEAKKQPLPEFVPLFSPGQVSAARDYAALVERCAASGVKGMSLEVLGAKAAGGGDREVAIFRDFQRLRSLQRRIGDGIAKEARRIRPRGERRRAIRVRSLVDMVCIGGLTVTDVLRRHGWGEKNVENRAAIVAALRAALDRMRGYDLVRPQQGG